jgi:DUF4097 and DUF4098 domain-containing protein YvlB
MTRKNMKDTIAITLFASTLLAHAAWAQREEFHRTLEVTAGAALSIGNIAGDIVVEGGPGSSIVIEAVKSVDDPDDADLLRAVEIQVSQVGNRVRVSTEHTGMGGRGHKHRRGGDVSVSYRVKVPEATEVEIQSVSGNVTLASVDGLATVQSVSGNVRVTDVSELSEAQAVSGDVEVTRARSGRRMEIESVSGEVRVQEVEASELSVSSVSGDVLLRGVSSRGASLESVSGDLEYTGTIAASGRYDFQSHSGDVVLTLADQVGFQLEASTFSGEIESDFTLKNAARDEDGRSLSAVAGDGSAIIEASTFSGDIRIVRRR